MTRSGTATCARRAGTTARRARTTFATAFFAASLSASLVGCGGGGGGSADDGGADARADADGPLDGGPVDAPPTDAPADAPADAPVDAYVPPLPDECGTAPLAYDGTLCGPSGTPCEELVDEQVDPPAFRNDAPSIALDGDGQPAILHARATGSFEGHLARRDGGSGGSGGWTNEPITSPVLATGSLGFDADGAPMIVTDDGAFDVGLHRLDGSSWTMLGDLPDGHVGEGSLAVDEGGCVHVLHSIESDPTTDDVPMMASAWQDGEWLRNVRVGLDIPWPGRSFGAQALAPRGASPQMAWSGWNDTRGYRVHWTDGERTESVWTASHTRYHGLPLRVEMGIADAPDAAEPTPHVLFSEQDLETGALYAAARQDGGWDVRTVGQWSLEGCDSSIPPADSTDTCSYVHTRVQPIGVATSGNGDARYLYVREVESADLTAECTTPPGGMRMCTWTSDTVTFDAALEIAWRDDAEDGGIATAVIAEDGWPWAGSVAVDGEGTIHVALYDRPSDGGTDSVVRYVQLGAP